MIIALIIIIIAILGEIITITSFLLQELNVLKDCGFQGSYFEVLNIAFKRKYKKQI